MIAGLAVWYFLGDSFESALALDQAGKSAQAIKAYQGYLKHHASAPQSSKACYRIGKNLEAQSNYNDALKWYEKTLKDYPRSDEATLAVIDAAVIYRDKLKDPAKALAYGQQAFDRYMNNGQLKIAVQSLIDDQFQTATAAFKQKDYKKAAELSAGIFKSYPAALLSSDSGKRIEAFHTRARRAAGIWDASVDSIILSEEAPFDKSYEGDFTALDPDDKPIGSPDGKYFVQRKKDGNGNRSLYLAKAPKKGKKTSFKRIKGTTGAYRPDWSPNSHELVYCRSEKGERNLELLDAKTLVIQNLFHSKSQMGIHPVYHPSGNKIAYVYEGRVCLINTGDKASFVYEGPVSSVNTGGTYFKQLLKTKEPLNYTADLQWSADGTMVRCGQTDKRGKKTDELLFLDVTTSTNP